MRTFLAAALAASLIQPGPSHTTHPDAQWFPDAALGLFLHWDPASVKGQNIGWSVIPGRAMPRPAAVTLLRAGSPVPYTFTYGRHRDDHGAGRKANVLT
jgi:hypothetical protein